MANAGELLALITFVGDVFTSHVKNLFKSFFNPSVHFLIVWPSLLSQTEFLMTVVFNVSVIDVMLGSSSHKCVWHLCSTSELCSTSDQSVAVVRVHLKRQTLRFFGDPTPKLKSIWMLRAFTENEPSLRRVQPFLLCTHMGTSAEKSNKLWMKVLQFWGWDC